MLCSPGEMKSVWASCAAFKSVESHKAETPEWPLGILCELPALIRRQLPTTEGGNGQRRWAVETVWREESVKYCHVGDYFRMERD